MEPARGEAMRNRCGWIRKISTPMVSTAIALVAASGVGRAATLTPVLQESPKSPGVAVPNVLSVELSEQIAAQGSNPVENPMSVDLGSGITLSVPFYSGLGGLCPRCSRGAYEELKQAHHLEHVIPNHDGGGVLLSVGRSAPSFPGGGGLAAWRRPEGRRAMGGGFASLTPHARCCGR
jgi:hypothetical protein